MPIKPSRATHDEIIRAYEAGESIRLLASRFPHQRSTISALLKQAGVFRSRRYQSLTAPQMSEVLEAYKRGSSEQALAEHYGVSRQGIHRALRRHGITPRSILEANTLMMQQRTPEEHRRNTQAAHQAVRGQPQPWDRRLKNAQTRERTGSGSTAAERLLGSWLEARGLSVRYQQAIGPYNCDLGIFPVAVEVCGGHWHGHGHHARKLPDRIRYFFDQGWHIVFVWVTHPLKHPLVPQITDYLITRVEFSRSNPTIRRQYWMVWGDGQPQTVPSLQVQDRTLIPASH